MKLVPLTKGYSAVVDDNDYDLVMRFKWQASPRKSGKVYAVTKIARPGRSSTSLYMHRLIVAASDFPDVDHWDNDGLNNTRANLRPCTESQNLANQSGRPGTTSEYKGVHWCKKERMWIASIGMKNPRVKRIGCFESEENAAIAYDIAAFKQWGEFAKLNFPGEVRDEQEFYAQFQSNKIKRRRHDKPFSSVFGGVVWHKSSRKWMARVLCDGKRVYAGSFDSELEAALAHDVTAIRLLGNKAKLNFPDETTNLVVESSLQTIAQGAVA